MNEASVPGPFPRATTIALPPLDEAGGAKGSKPVRAQLLLDCTDSRMAAVGLNGD